MVVKVDNPYELVDTPQFMHLMDKWELEWGFDLAETVNDKDDGALDESRPSFILKTMDDRVSGILGYRILVYDPHHNHCLLKGPEFDEYIKYYEFDGENSIAERSKDLEIMLYHLKRAVDKLKSSNV